MAETKEAAPARSFSVFLATLGEGDANRELSKMLLQLGEALINASQERNAIAKGSIALKINMSIDPRGVANVAWDCKLTEPKPLRHSSMMWADKNGQLVHENPRQQKLPLHEVNARDRVIEVDEATGTARAAREV